MDITCGSQKLAQDLDIFAISGGFAKAYQVRADVFATGNRLELLFKGKVGNAKFNAIRVLDQDGNPVASLMAKDWTNADPRLAKIPEIKRRRFI